MKYLKGLLLICTPPGLLEHNAAMTEGMMMEIMAQDGSLVKKFLKATVPRPRRLFQQLVRIIKLSTII